MNATSIRIAIVLVAASGACTSDANKPAEAEAAKAGAQARTPDPKSPDDESPDAKSPSSGARSWTFDDAPAGAPAPGFTLGETASTGTPATWAVVARDDAPSPPNVFAITKTTNRGQTYNVALAEGTSAADLDLSVMVHAGEGEEDQGGGVAFRAAGPDDYYVARWNPLENNAAFFVVQKGVRTSLGKQPVQADPAEWHEVRVVAQGSRLQMFLDDEPVLSVEDSKITGAGMVGLWTKADAASLFDDLSLGKP